jgi:hypothetical protein
VVDSVAINCVAHDALFAKAERFIYVASAVIGLEYVEKKPVCGILAKGPIGYRGQKLST